MKVFRGVGEKHCIESQNQTMSVFSGREEAKYRIESQEKQTVNEFMGGGVKRGSKEENGRGACCCASLVVDIYP